MPAPIDPTRDRPTVPVRARRQQVARWTLLANRVGYLFVALAVATFIIGFAISFNATVATIVVVSLVIGCLLYILQLLSNLVRWVQGTERDTGHGH